MQVRISFFTIDGTYMYDVLLEHAYKAHLELLLHIRTQLNDGQLADCPKDQLFYTLVNPYDGNRHSYPHLFLPVELRPSATFPLMGVANDAIRIGNTQFEKGKLYDFTHHLALNEFEALLKDGTVSDARTNIEPGRSG
jgi:hypothetical protein